MKTFLIIFAFLFSMTMQAQRATVMTSSGDTVVNTATKYVSLKVSTANDVASFQAVNTKISGTVAGKTYFKASNDGTNFITLDSLTNTNQATNTKIFYDSPSKYLYYRLYSTGVGNMSMRTYGYAVLRR